MRSAKTYLKRIVSAILAASRIFSATPVSETDGTGEPEVTVTDVPITGEETTPAGSETEIAAEITVPEISELPETSETVAEPLDFIENDFSLFSAAASAIQLNKVSETD